MTLTEQEADNRKMRPAEFKGRRLFTSHFTRFVFLISLVVLIFTIGCPPTEHGPVELPRTEPNEVGPVVEPNVVEPNVVEPNVVEPNVVEPNVVEPNVVEPNAVEPNVVEPNVVEPNEKKVVPKVSFHDKCADILGSFVNNKGMVDYRRLKRKRLELGSLLEEFAKLDPNEYDSWPKEDKIALWINAFNIQMLNIIVQNYPIEASRLDKFWWPPTSLRHIPPRGVVGAAKWDKYKFLVKGEEFTLARIERRFFREEFDEPRVFFAISHACRSSAPLRSEPYSGHKLDEQLNDQVKRFLSSPRGFKIDRKKQIVYLYAMLKPVPSRYGQEFLAKYGTDKKFKDEKPGTRAVLNFISNYISAQDKFFLLREYYDVKYIKFDWRVNDSSRKP
jgi:hypothetical protein